MEEENGEEGDEERPQREKKMKRNEGNASLLAEILEREERNQQLFFCGPKLKCRNTWVPQAWVKFAHSFKYVGTLIPRSTIINYHFLTLGKIIYQK